MQWVSSRIWTRVAVFISYNNNNYTTGTSKKYRGYPRGVMVKAMDYEIEILYSEMNKLS